jgi:type I restriction enzyme S subunit
VSLVKGPGQIVAEAEASGVAGLLVRHPGWERRPFKSFGTVQNGAPFSSSDFNLDGRGLPLLRIRDVGKNRTSTYFDGEFSGEFVVNHGDLLVGMDGDFRVSRWRGPRSLLNQRVCRFCFCVKC